MKIFETTSVKKRHLVDNTKKNRIIIELNIDNGLKDMSRYYCVVVNLCGCKSHACVAEADTTTTTANIACINNNNNEKREPQHFYSIKQLSSRRARTRRKCFDAGACCKYFFFALLCWTDVCDEVIKWVSLNIKVVQSLWADISRKMCEKRGFLTENGPFSMKKSQNC